MPPARAPAWRKPLEDQRRRRTPTHDHRRGARAGRRGRARAARHRSGGNRGAPGRRADHRAVVPDPEPDRPGQGDQREGHPLRHPLVVRRAHPAREPDQPGRPGLQLEPDRPDHEGPQGRGHHAPRDRLQHARPGRSRAPTRAFPSAYNPNAPRAAQYADFMQALATRYSGAFPDPAAPTTLLPRLRLIEIWNEPNLKNFFRFNTATSIPQVQGPRSRPAYPRIKAANRNAVVIGGVGGPAQQHGQRQHRRPRLAERPGARRARRSSTPTPSTSTRRSGPSSRPGPANAFPSWGSLPEIFATLDKKKKGMKLFITEAGYTTATTPFRNVKVTPAVQNLYLKQIFALPLGQEPARGGRGLVQPPGQRQLARRAPVRERRAEAGVRRRSRGSPPGRSRRCCAPC